MSLNMSGLNDIIVDTITAYKVDSQLIYVNNVPVSSNAINYISTLRMNVQDQIDQFPYANPDGSTDNPINAKKIYDLSGAVNSIIIDVAKKYTNTTRAVFDLSSAKQSSNKSISDLALIVALNKTNASAGIFDLSGAIVLN